MSALRRLIFGHRRLIAVALAVVMAVKLLVPGGYMVERQNGRLALTICSGVAAPEPAVAMPDMTGHAMAGHVMPPATGQHDDGRDHGKVEMPCAFAALSAVAVAPVDPMLLLAELAFVAALALLPIRPRLLRATPYLRPPLRGPPPILRLA